MIFDGNDILDHHKRQNHMLRASLCRKEPQIEHHLIITDAPVFKQGLQPCLDLGKLLLNG